MLTLYHGRQMWNAETFGEHKPDPLAPEAFASLWISLVNPLSLYVKSLHSKCINQVVAI